MTAVTTLADFLYEAEANTAGAHSQQSLGIMVFSGLEADTESSLTVEKLIHALENCLKANYSAQRITHCNKNNLANQINAINAYCLRNSSTMAIPGIQEIAN